MSARRKSGVTPEGSSSQTKHEPKQFCKGIKDWNLALWTARRGNVASPIKKYKESLTWTETDAVLWTQRGRWYCLPKPVFSTSSAAAQGWGFAVTDVVCAASSSTCTLCCLQVKRKALWGVRLLSNLHRKLWKSLSEGYQNDPNQIARYLKNGLKSARAWTDWCPRSPNGSPLVGA